VDHNPPHVVVRLPDLFVEPSFGLRLLGVEAVAATRILNARGSSDWAWRLVSLGRRTPTQRGSASLSAELNLLTCRPLLQPVLSYQEATHGSAKSDGQEAEMAYERLDEALRQLKTDSEREEAAEKQQKRAGSGELVL
jgi:hypothetical protein